MMIEDQERPKMANERTRNSGVSLESKSQVGALTRQIDGLVREYVIKGGDDFAVRASKLSRERENLLKPEIIRSGRIKQAS